MVNLFEQKKGNATKTHPALQASTLCHPLFGSLAATVKSENKKKEISYIDSSPFGAPVVPCLSDEADSWDEIEGLDAFLTELDSFEPVVPDEGLDVPEAAMAEVMAVAEVMASKEEVEGEEEALSEEEMTEMAELDLEEFQLWTELEAEKPKGVKRERCEAVVPTFALVPSLAPPPCSDGGHCRFVCTHEGCRKEFRSAHALAGHQRMHAPPGGRELPVKEKRRKESPEKSALLAMLENPAKLKSMFLEKDSQASAANQPRDGRGRFMTNKDNMPVQPRPAEMPLLQPLGLAPPSMVAAMVAPPSAAAVAPAAKKRAREELPGMVAFNNHPLFSFSKTNSPTGSPPAPRPGPPPRWRTCRRPPPWGTSSRHCPPSWPPPPRPQRAPRR